jgi:hypothetical protein
MPAPAAAWTGSNACSRGHLDCVASVCPAFAGLTSELDALVAGTQRTMIVKLTAEMERRAAAALEASGIGVVHGPLSFTWGRGACSEAAA